MGNEDALLLDCCVDGENRADAYGVRPKFSY
jgi:hypothetical protein